MKKIFFLVLLFSFGASASEVRVTSFRFLNTSGAFSAAAEICGEIVKSSGSPEMVTIIADPKSKGPGEYHAWAGKNGRFCSVIASFTGQAEVRLAD